MEALTDLYCSPLYWPEMPHETVSMSLAFKNDFLFLNVVFATVLLVLSLNNSTSQTRKNVFCFTSKARSGQNQILEF